MKTSRNIPPAFAATVRLAIIVGSLGALSACASIPERAWRNGEAMTASRAYQRVNSGDLSMEAHRQLQQSLDPLRLNYREVAYPAFGRWW